jgi:hypothetical protein
MLEYPVRTTAYRGYDIVHDDHGADIWSGGDWIDTQYSGDDPLAKAKRVVDEWLDAP